MATEAIQQADAAHDPVFKVRIGIDVFVQAKTEQAARSQLSEMDLEQINYEVDQGAFVAGTKEIVDVTPVPDDQLDEELAKVGSDGDFFRI